MKNLVKYLIPVVIIFLVLFCLWFKFFSNLVKVSGKVLLIEGNNMPILAKRTNSISDINILAIRGKVKNTGNQKRILISKLNQKRYKSKSNRKGYFFFVLQPGIYTFFIVEKNYAYLNNFDGLGYFKYICVENSDLNLTLIDDRNALY